MLLHKDTILLSSIFLIPLLAISIGNINIGGANLQFFLAVTSMLIAIFYLIKWGEFKVNIFIIPLLFILFLTIPLFNSQFGVIQIIYVFIPFLYFMCGAYSSFDFNFNEKIKNKIKTTILLLLIFNFIELFGEYTQINSRPASIFISLIAMIAIIVLDDLKDKMLIVLLFLFVLFSGARGALIAGIIPLIFSYINKKISFKFSALLCFILAFGFFIFNEKVLSLIFSIDALRERTFYDGIYNYEKILNLEFNSSGRDIAWPIYWEHIVERSKNIFSTVFGEGPGATSVIGVEKLGDKWAHPHNEFIRILIDYGFLGLLSFLLFWSTIFYKVLKNKNKGITRLFISMLIFVILIAMTDNPLMYPLYFGNLILFLTGLSFSNRNIKY